MKKMSFGANGVEIMTAIKIIRSVIDFTEQLQKSSLPRAFFKHALIQNGGISYGKNKKIKWKEVFCIGIMHDNVVVNGNTCSCRNEGIYADGK